MTTISSDIKNKNGYLYCFSNSSMPGLYKIGMTSRTPEERLAEANKSNTYKPPTPYKIEFQIFIQDVQKYEKIIHKILEQRGERIRERMNREFFKTNLFIVRRLFDIICDYNNLNISYDEHTKNLKQRRNEIKKELKKIEKIESIELDMVSSLFSICEKLRKYEYHDDDGLLNDKQILLDNLVKIKPILDNKNYLTNEQQRIREELEYCNKQYTEYKKKLDDDLNNIKYI